MPMLRLLLAACFLLAPAPGRAGGASVHEPIGFRSFASPQVNPVAVSPSGHAIYVANTTSNTLSVLTAAPLQQVRQVSVGLEPVSVAVKPDGSEVWVANHVSDSISVVDVRAGSASFGEVVETIQVLDGALATQFDEPSGIAFAGDDKAYVALSSRDQIAVVDTATYQVTGFLSVRGSEPRAIAVRNGLLYVAAFEGHNRSEISACPTLTGSNVIGAQCTLGLPQIQAFVTEPNVPSGTKNIVIDPQAPDRDLFVYDTATDQEIAAVSGIGTLLYGLAVDGNGRAFITQTDARNHVNGDHGEILASLQNRMFDNELAAVTCTASGCGAPSVVNLEPGGTTHANSLATPYGIALSADGSTILMTAAGASRIATFDASLAGGPRDTLDVGAMPRGVALYSPSGATGTAYVLSSLDNTLWQVALGANGALTHVASVTVGRDPTPAAVRRGAIAFNDAFASTSGNFSCGSCHPDAHVDQLLWRIGGDCGAIGCIGGGDEPRTTMPIRGLASTLPLHWDGTLGDPFGGGNGAVGLSGNGGTDCALGDADGEHDCFLDLVNASLAGVMCDQTTACPPGGNELSAQERDDLATFIAAVAYPPARSRRLGDNPSRTSDPVPATQGGAVASARKGFAEFFTNQDGGAQPRSCADEDGGCHALPLGVATNSSTLNGFDAPSMRGLTDRTLQFSLGITNAEEILAFATAGNEPGFVWNPNAGFREQSTFGAAFFVFESVYGVRPVDIFQMIEEAGTGTSGATGRQLTLNTATAGTPETLALMNALEAADARGAVNLRALGRRNNQALLLSFNGVTYRGTTLSLTPAQLRSEAAAGVSFATLTAHLRKNAGATPQPLISTLGAVSAASAIGDPPLPTLAASGDPAPFSVAGSNVSALAAIAVNGAATAGSVTCGAGSTNGFCNPGAVSIDLSSSPGAGLHLLQLQNPAGLFSNELPICAGSDVGCRDSE